MSIKNESIHNLSVLKHNMTLSDILGSVFLFTDTNKVFRTRGNIPA